MPAADPTLQSRLHDGDGPPDRGPGVPATADPTDLLGRLEGTGRFHRDAGLGRIFHPGQLSLREDVPADSLHLIVDGDRVGAHVDRVSPLGADAARAFRYSLRRAVAHNLSGMAEDLVRLLRGRQGDHRCELNCVLLRDPRDPGAAGELLDPEASSWSVQLEVRVSGSLDEDRLRAALATVAGAGAGGEDVLEAVDEPDDDALDRARDRLHRMGVPVARRPPLHAVLARSGAGDVVMLSVNHAAGDAFAAVEVLVAVARAYAPDDAGAGGAPLDFLATHALPFGPAPGPRSRLVRTHKRGVERLRDLLAPPARLTADEPDEQSGYGFHLVTVPAEETSRLLAPGATEPGRTAVMTALHLAIGDWHRRHGGPGRRVGVLGTVDLRPHPWRPATIGNFSMTARVATTPYQRARADRALRAVNAQTTRNKRTRTGIALIAALDRAGLLPLWVSQSVVVLRPVTHNRFVDTAVLCNLGSVEAPSFGPEAGETLGLWCSAPARSPHALSVGVTTAGGRLHLTFRYPHRLFGAAAARRFAACYLAQLRAVVEAQGRAEGR